MEINNLEGNNPNPQISVKFNFSNEILQRVSFLQFNASGFYREGNLDKWFFEWVNIKHQLKGKIEEEAKLNPEGKVITKWKLLDLERKIGRLLELSPYHKNRNKILGILIESYLSLIQYKIEEWGMGLVNKPDETSFA